MRSTLILLVPIVAYAAAVPAGAPENGQLSARNTAEFPAFAGREITTEAASYPAKTQSQANDAGMTDSSLPTSRDHNRAETDDSLQSPESKGTMTNRKCKAFLDLDSKQPNAVRLDVNCDVHEARNRSTSKRPSNSDIFYVRLPPVPYMYVPGLGYISHPPRYSTNISWLQYEKPAKQKPTVKPFIKVPVDFVANGKPTSVYQWQKPADSPITKLDRLSADFNGKPSTIYEWEGLSKPIKIMNKDNNGKPLLTAQWEGLSKPMKTMTKDTIGKPSSSSQWEGMWKPKKTMTKDTNAKPSPSAQWEGVLKLKKTVIKDINAKPSSSSQWEDISKPMKTMTKDINAKPSTIPLWERMSKPIKTTTKGINAKPSSISQREGVSKPIKTMIDDDDVVNELDKGPYNFDGKPIFVYILNSDGTTSHRQRIRHH